MEIKFRQNRHFPTLSQELFSHTNASPGPLINIVTTTAKVSRHPNTPPKRKKGSPTHLYRTWLLANSSVAWTSFPT